MNSYHSVYIEISALNASPISLGKPQTRRALSKDYNWVEGDDGTLWHCLSTDRYVLKLRTGGERASLTMESLPLETGAQLTEITEQEVEETMRYLDNVRRSMGLLPQLRGSI